MGTRAFRQAAQANQILQPDRHIPFKVTVASVGTPAVIWAPSGPNARFRMMGVNYSTSIASVSAAFKDGTASAFLTAGKTDVANKQVEINLGRGYLSGTDTNSLRIDSDIAGVTFTGTVYGREE